MPAITITDLNNAKLDVDHIADIATSSEATATDRLGNTKRTIAGVVELLNAELEVFSGESIYEATTSANAAAAAAAGSASNAAGSATAAAASAAEAATYGGGGSSASAQVATRVEIDGKMLRRAIDSVRYAPATENRKYAYTSLNSAKKTNTDGGNKTVWEPDGVGGYGHAWTRDMSMSMEGYLDYFGADEIAAVANYFLSKSNLTTGEVPDHISHAGTVYWTPGSANTWGSRAPIDGNTYLLQMFWLHYVKTGSASLYNTNKVALKGLIETGIPYNATTKCVTISDASPFVGFGFYDTVKATGDVLFPSILAYRAFLQLTELEFALGNTAEALRLQARADEIKTGINSTLLIYYDIEGAAPNYVRKLAFYKTSTIKCSGQLDMWGTCFAVWSDIPNGEFAKMISSNLQGIVGDTANATVYAGAVRHVVKSTDYSGTSLWESTFYASTYGQYQNGGFWHTPTPWMCYALSLVSPTAAKTQYDAMITSMQGQGDSIRPVEWMSSSGGFLGSGKYATSAVAPLMCGDTLPFSDVATVSGAGDSLAVLVNAEVAVTTTATLTVAKMHVCSGTTADYVATLPAVASSAGKFVGVRMSWALTKLVTIKGNASELIDGSNTRVMWAGESATFYCDGLTWTKVAGKSIPMIARAYLSANQAIAAQTLVKVLLNTASTDLNNAGVFVAANNRFEIRRGGTWKFVGGINFTVGASAGAVIAQLNKNGASYQQLAFAHMSSTLNITVTGGAMAPAAAGDYFDLNAYFTPSTATVGGFAYATFMHAEELITW